MSHNVPAGNRLPLETGRLVLRLLSADEVDPLHRISNEPMVRLYLWDDQPNSEATIKGLIAHSDRTFSKEKTGQFGVRLRGRKISSAFAASFASRAWRSRSSATS
jgi:RimJ/RimL family protein N-acetyltransferase